MLVISMNTDAALNQLQEQFKFKNDKVKETSNYLGALSCNKIIDGREKSTMTIVGYVFYIIKTLEESLKVNSGCCHVR